MSLGINLMAKMAKSVVPALEDSFNVEIVETHHNQKKDSPSGTALMLAEAVAEASSKEREFVFGRHGKADEIKISDIGIHSLRGGTMPGEHTLLFFGPDEVIEIKHTAYSRKIFAQGALKAAKFIVGKAPGMYDMNDVIG
jgi:4-hydroxy-tetrahydrodipicolinate reductase